MAQSLIWLVLTIFHEARNQPIEGQVAVCQAVLNRTEVKHKSAYEVIEQPWQFEWTINGVDLQALGNEPQSIKRAVKAATICLERRISGNTMAGVTHFYNPEYANPPWIKSMTVVAKIQDHIFLAE